MAKFFLVVLILYFYVGHSAENKPITEYQIMTEEQIGVEKLKNHFLKFYEIMVEASIVPQAVANKEEGILSYFSGSGDPYHNVVMGCPNTNSDWHKCIKNHLAFFSIKNTPFAWYLDEGTSPEFEKDLLEHGLRNGGIFRGVIGPLDAKKIQTQGIEGVSFEQVEDDRAMNEWTDLVCTTFGMESIKADYKKAMQKAKEEGKMFHWTARKEGRVVSALSVMMEGDMMSFWNMASLPEIRRKGISTALCCYALQHAVSCGCTVGASYLMSDGLAYGICRKFGFETKWRFKVFLSE